MSEIIRFSFFTNGNWGSAYEALKIKQLGFEAQKAYISYEPGSGLRPYRYFDHHRFPLEIEGILNNHIVVLQLYNESAGYDGDGPMATVKLLRDFGFEIDEADILTSKRMDEDGEINLEYCR